MTKVRFLVVGLAMVAAFSSCKKEGCTDPTATNYDSDAKEDDGSCIAATVDSKYTQPSTYVFTRNNETSVSYSGQTNRLDMLSEMTSYLKSANTPGTSLDATKLLNMYANENSPWSTADLNESSKQLKNKTAGGDASIQAYFEGLMNAAAAGSDSTVTGQYDGANGKIGVVQSGTKAYLMDAKGMEYTQLIEKGLMGAVFYHQITNVYLGSGKMDVDNESLVDGKNYTKMEHHWDEAFGYFTSAPDFPANGTDRFWGKYSNSRDGLLGTNSAIMTAYLKGRTAIINKDYTARDEAIAEIRKQLERVCAGTAIHYLNSAKADFADDALRNHTLSEARAFINDLRFGYEPSLSGAQLDAILAKLGDNNYEVKTADIDWAIDQLGAIQDLASHKANL
ncbi:DUF4856 domain-containing protein [bacterium SCSIO 12741]|nr:DUF4856 domain-containing protein [bacterium SCSIO 12741]